MKGLNTTLSMLRVAQLVGLSIYTKALEDIHYAKATTMESMLKNGQSQHNINAFIYRFEEDLARYKRKSVQSIINVHPKMFKEAVPFNDWPTAMHFLNENRVVLSEFLKKDEADD